MFEKCLDNNTLLKVTSGRQRMYVLPLVSVFDVSFCIVEDALVSKYIKNQRDAFTF